MENTPRNIVMQLGALIALYLSVSFFLTLLFGLINLVYPSAADAYYDIENASDNVRLGIAMLVVFFPTYVLLTRLVHEQRRAKSQSEYEPITKWLIYLSLLIAGLTLLGTLVMSLYTFLNGDLTIRFAMKAAAVLAVVGMSFHYYVLEARGYWIRHESRSFMFAVGVCLVIFITLAFGVKHIDTPTVVYDMKIDEQQVNDLRTIQYQLESYLMASSSTLPQTLEEAFVGSGTTIPTASAERAAYSYELTDKGFRLCATFSHNSVNTGLTPAMIDSKATIKNGENWNYQAGRYCFERSTK